MRSSFRARSTKPCTANFRRRRKATCRCRCASWINMCAVQQQIDRLVVEQVETLCEALLDFQSKEDLRRWLKQHATAR
ncbi:MAG TPA: DUF4351 domain-containing protein [Blastocatellia bacterium]|nr:DUF4351 domain-containing protein [Blastocatellia bacterium]